jgi:hypothetical protein
MISFTSSITDVPSSDCSSMTFFSSKATFDARLPGFDRRVAAICLSSCNRLSTFQLINRRPLSCGRPSKSGGAPPIMSNSTQAFEPPLVFNQYV